MTVICENCQTANRDKAKFCIGCARKLPAFSATGPAAVAASERTRRQRQRNAGVGDIADGAALQYGEGRNAVRWWFAAVLLLGALVAVLIGWIALAPARTMVPATAVAPASAVLAVPAVSAASASPPASPASSTFMPTGPVSFESALAPGETAVVANPDDATAAENVQEPAPRASPTPRSSTSRATGNGRADPRVGCEHLFFAFAARCEANHCAQAAYTRHPRCDVVRAERQRDDARRNMTSGY